MVVSNQGKGKQTKENLICERDEVKRNRDELGILSTWFNRKKGI